jgi:flagellar basal body-associated protein FliL
MEVNFTTLREKLKKAINEVLGTPWIQEVLFTEYGFESQ